MRTCGLALSRDGHCYPWKRPLFKSNRKEGVLDLLLVILFSNGWLACCFLCGYVSCCVVVGVNSVWASASVALEQLCHLCRSRVLLWFLPLCLFFLATDHLPFSFISHFMAAVSVDVLVMERSNNATWIFSRKGVSLCVVHLALSPWKVVLDFVVMNEAVRGCVWNPYFIVFLVLSRMPTLGSCKESLYLVHGFCLC